MYCDNEPPDEDDDRPTDEEIDDGDDPPMEPAQVADQFPDDFFDPDEDW